MSLNSNKRKPRQNLNNKITRSRGTACKDMASDGVYGNSRFMHSAASLVGCIVQIQVRNGAFYEGIFRTFSDEFDLVLAVPHKIDKKMVPAKGLSPTISNLLVSFPFEDGIADTLVFKLKDVVVLNASNVDLDYAIKDNFTDSAISKYNGQIAERTLEPWDESIDDEALVQLDGGDNDGANGWDADQMFQVNAERYNVKSTYDNSLQEYTVPLTKKNTEEYRKQEARALKIAQEIESNVSYQTHIQFENGDEEDRFSAVIRPDGTNPSRYLPPQKRMGGVGAKRPMALSTSSSVLTSGQRSYQPQPPNLNSCVASNQNFKSPPLPSKHPQSPSVQASSACSVASSILPMSMPKDMVDRTINGEEAAKEETNAAVVSDHIPPVSTSVKLPAGPIIPQPLPPRPDRRRENERKLVKQKGRDDEIEEFKKFSSSFKLSEECKDLKEEKDDFQVTMDLKDEAVNKISDLKISDKTADVDDDKIDIVKSSTLNPNAKEFVMNPNAKSFTPRSMAVTSPHTPLPLQPQRMHSQSPVMAMSHGPMVHGMGQPVFATMGPQYIMQATPVSMTLTSPFAGTLSQAPRIRKVPIMQPRHDISPSMHVAAATGQPILAPNPIPNPSQLTMQYNPPPGMIHAPGPPQQTMGYPQMSYVVGPRGMSPQPVGMVPTSHTVSYDTAHLNAHVFMPAHPSAAALSAVTAAHSMQQGAAGQHSNQHPPQSHTPVIHPSPSPVHQPPPNHVVNPSQPPTPTTIMYPGQMNQHMQSGHHHNSNQPPLNAHVSHHAANFPGGPQPVVLMQQQAMSGSHTHHPGPLAGPHPLHLHSIHGQNPGNHIGAPTQVLPQMTVIPTSAAMVSAPNSLATSPFVPHPQGLCIKGSLKKKNR